MEKMKRIKDFNETDWAGLLVGTMLFWLFCLVFIPSLRSSDLFMNISFVIIIALFLINVIKFKWWISIFESIKLKEEK